LNIIAHIENAYQTKFGIPRQSGLVTTLQSKIIFEPAYRNRDAFRGLEAYSHIWLLWQFSDAIRENWSPTVRPPRLGGNQRMGVFATRSPFRPNPIGLSVVQLHHIAWEEAAAPVLYVNGADLMNGTPIYDIKPYLPHIDSHPEATGGFALDVADYALQVVFPEIWLEKVPSHLREALCEILAQDPRPSYQHDAERVYGFCFAGLEIKFTVQDLVLTVCSVTPQDVVPDSKTERR
jgi:tRNA-Thr(GGU) m(6)t(6)A37 methyltransferase TsaA